MSGPTFNRDTQQFVDELDDAAQCHLAWTRRLLRCALLKTAPGGDMLDDEAHRHCPFGLWLQRNRPRFDELDSATVLRLQRRHRQMHDAARRLCRRLLDGGAGNADDVDAFESAQSGVVADLALLKTEYLAHSARLDVLTGLPLRHGLEDEFHRSRAQAQRHREKLFALMLDLDEFKRVNDERGHASGDLALQHVAALLRAHCRAGEPVIRFGGEEFLALIQAADRQAAQHAVERILQALRDTPLALSDGQTIFIRASAGIAEVGRIETLAAAVARADRALYAAKAAGRDTWRWPAAAP